MEDRSTYFVKMRRKPLYITLVGMALQAGYMIWGAATWVNYVGIIAMPLALGWTLGKFHGHPRNWWHVYLGRDVELDSDKLKTEYGSVEAADEAIKQWLEVMKIKPYMKHHSYRYQFLRKKQAAQFKIAWG